ncbi:MAG: NAD-dependent epimerase/dehydratase family protein [Chloroflexi bacterium]|nr:NAD-dependent epimerase/dehydratase family protein [Chloroflexota bacterium]
MARVLVTGGAGFIGSHTVDLLLARGYAVRILDSLQPRVHPLGKPDYVPPEAEFIQGDVANPADLDRALQGVDYLVHLAAYQDYLPDFSTFIHVNTESTALLFELIVARGYPVRKIVFASSQSVAGEGKYRCPQHGVVTPDLRPEEQLQGGAWEVRCPTCGIEMESLLIDEEVARPHTAYGVSKYAIELLARSLGARYRIPTACMRYTYVQGARNSFYNAYSGICRIFALRLRHGLPPVCYEDGQQRRDYVNVADVARANLLAMEEPGQVHRVYNVGGGRPVTVLEFARIMVDAYGSSLEPSVPGLYRLGDTRHTISDISAMQHLGWQPAIPVEQNVSEYLEWMSRYEATQEYLEEAERAMRQQNVLRQVRQPA